MFLQPIGDDVRNIYKNYHGEISLYQVLPVAAPEEFWNALGL